MPSFSKLDLFYFLYHFYNSLNDLNKSIFFKSQNPKQIFERNHDSLVQFLKKTYPNKNFNLPIDQLTRDFHSSFLNSFLSNIIFKNSIFDNLNNIKKVLIELKNKNLKAVEADKNIGITLIKSDIYYSLAMDHLNDKNFYLPIDFDPKIKIVKESSEMVLNLKRSNHISEQLFSLISKNLLENKLPQFRLYKAKFGIRPLINCSRTT